MNLASIAALFFRCLFSFNQTPNAAFRQADRRRKSFEEKICQEFSFKTLAHPFRTASPHRDLPHMPIALHLPGARALSGGFRF
ncbi:hypothetical protein [Leisingera sp. ANG-M6]|uniref:hypothetical protein n=1 Tax=Leisingera sp. ANG-M6 TaxID=1577900 RepID=UPI00126A6DF4|nr:hypothetical protein [Leisingera sp. ANG-M6]